MPRGIYVRTPSIPTIRDNLMKKQLQLCNQLDTYLSQVDFALEVGDITQEDHDNIIRWLRESIKDPAI